MNKYEPVLFTTKKLAIFAGVALTALALAFPGKRLFKSFNNHPTDVASLAYMRAAFKRNPDDPALRIRLVEKLYEINQITEADTLLKPLVLSTQPSQAVSTLNLKLKLRQYFDATSLNQKNALKQIVIVELNRLFPQLIEISALDELAELSLQLGEPLIAAQIYQKIVEIKERSVESISSWTVSSWLGIANVNASESKDIDYYIKHQLQALLAANQGNEALQWAQRYVSRYPQNSMLLEVAIEIAQSQNNAVLARDWGRQLLDLQKTLPLIDDNIPSCQNDLKNDRYFWQCVQNKEDADKNIHLPSVAFMHFVKRLEHNRPLQQQLQKELAANQLDNSVAWIQQQLSANPMAEDLLRAACILAKSQGNKQLARQWGERLLLLKPFDLELLKQQIDFEMALPDLPKALAYNKRWLELAPDDHEAHAKAADVALWSNDTETALAQLLWLFEHTQENTYFDKLTHLATSLFKHDLITELFTKIGTARQLTEKERNLWFNALQNSSREDAGAKVLQEYLRHWPQDKAAWWLLVKTFELLGKLEEAQATTTEIAKRFGKDQEVMLSQATYLIKQGKVEAAWQQLKNASHTVAAEDQKFWDNFAKMAFWVGDERELLNIYQQHPQAGHENSTFNYYFLSMLRQNSPEQYTQFAVKQFHKTRDPATLLNLIAFKIQQQAWDEARNLLSLVTANDTPITHSSQYWLAKSEVSGHFGDKNTALQALNSALKLQPESASIRSMLIWHLAAGKNLPELARLLQESRAQAENSPALWEAMAIGYRTSGQPKAALPWYAKAITQWPLQQPLVMGYAEVLQEANRPEQAKQLWRYVLTSFKPATHSKKSALTAVNSAFERRYAELVRLYLGASAGEKWLQWLQGRPTQQDSTFSEFRIAWFLAQQRQEQARAQLANAERKGDIVPPWQRLAIAMKANDKQAVGQLLNNPDQQLSKVDEISALRMIGDEPEALRKTKQFLDQQPSVQERQWLKTQATALNSLLHNGWAASGKLYNVSQLDIVNDNLELVLTKGGQRFFANYQDDFYSAVDPSFQVLDNMRHEQILAAEWSYHSLPYQANLKLGGHFRDDYNYFTADGGLHYELPMGLTGHLQAGYNSISSEGAIFRLAGLADKLEAGVTGKLSKREYYTLNLQGQHYKTRSGYTVGYGYGGGVEIGYKVFFEHPETVIALHGNWRQADLGEVLPTEWRGFVAPTIAMHNIINPSYKEVGLDLRLKEGEFNPFGYGDRSFRYALSTGGFFSDPTGNFGTKLEANIGMRLFKNDELSLSGYYASIQGGVQSESSTAIALRYSKRFD